MILLCHKEFLFWWASTRLVFEGALEKWGVPYTRVNTVISNKLRLISLSF